MSDPKTQAADEGAGSLEAMMALGQHYAASEEHKQAFYWYQNAAGKGDTTAQTHIGLMYAEGRGIQKSIPKAINCLKSAAENGSNFARGHLAEMLFRLKLYTESVRYAKMVYDQYKSDESDVFEERHEAEGLAISCYILGRCLMVSTFNTVPLLNMFV